MGWATGYQMSKQGIAEEKDRQAVRDLAERRMELAEKQFSAEERDRALKWMSEYSEANDKRNVSAKEKAKMKAKLLQMELGSTTADYIIGSGEAPGFIKVYDKRVLDGTLSKTWIKSVVKHVESILGDKESPQAVALAFSTALLSGEDQSKEEGQFAALQQISFNIMESGIVPEDFNENVARAIAGLNLPEPTIALSPIGNLTSGSKEISLDQTNKIESRFKDAVTPYVGQIYARDKIDNMPIGGLDYTKIKGQVDPVKIQELISTSLQDTIEKLQGYSSLNDSEIIKAGRLAVIQGANALALEAAEKNGNGDDNNKGKIPLDTSGGIAAAMGVPFNSTIEKEKEEKDQSSFDFIQKFERDK